MTGDVSAFEQKKRVVRRPDPYLLTIDRQVVALVGSVTLLSAFIKNIGDVRLANADSRFSLRNSRLQNHAALAR